MRVSTAIRLIPALICLFGAPPAAAQPIWAVTSGNTLISFDSSTPGTIASTVAITGLQGGESVVGIDFRPNPPDLEATQLFALGSTSRLDPVNRSTGAATQVGAGQFSTLLSGTRFGVDFEPVQTGDAIAETLRIVSDADQNLVIDADTGTVQTVGTNLVYDGGDENNGENPHVVGLTFDEGFFCCSFHEPIGLDTAQDALVRLGGLEGEPPSPDTWTLFTINEAFFDTLAGAPADFDSSPSGILFAVLTESSGEPFLYRIEGECCAFQVGEIGDGLSIAGGMAVQPVPPQLVALPVMGDFGSQPVGTIGGSLEVTIRNVGDAASFFLARTGAARDDFLPVGGTCQDFAEQPLATPNATCTFRLRFAPTAVGARSAALEFQPPSDAPPLLEYALSGTGTSAPLTSGATGATGAAGPAGPAGPIGPIGPIGPAGPAGRDRELLFALLGLDRYGGRAGRLLGVRFVSTLAAQATLEVVRGKRTVRSRDAAVEAGRNRVRIRMPSRAGRYAPRLTTVAGTQTSRDSARLRVRP